MFRRTLLCVSVCISIVFTFHNYCFGQQQAKPLPKDVNNIKPSSVAPTGNKTEKTINNNAKCLDVKAKCLDLTQPTEKGEDKKQNSGDTKKKSVKRVNKKSRKVAKKEDAPLPPPFLIGDSTISLTGDKSAPIKVGMSPGGITIVEFPANDAFFAIHPPKNGDWLEVEKSESLYSDTHLVLRAGKDLLQLTNAKNSYAVPAAILDAQMDSGLIVSFWVYPSKYIARQTGRLILKYDRDAIVAERRAGGLAVNLRNRVNDTEAQKNEKKDEDSKNTLPNQALNLDSNLIADLHGGVGLANGLPISEDSARTKQSRIARKMLDEAVANPKQFKKWTKQFHGLSLSTRTWNVDDNTIGVIIAIKNEESDLMRLIPGQPQMVIETFDNKGKSLQLSPIDAHIESTTANNIVPARATVYYSLVHKPQILSKLQRLRVAVAQTNAADDPAIADTNMHQ